MDKIDHGRHLKRCGYVREVESKGITDLIHYFKSAPSSVVDAFKQRNIQNVTVYNKDNRFYMYSEYSHTDFVGDRARLKTDTDMHQWVEGWTEMDKVFHTD